MEWNTPTPDRLPSAYQGRGEPHMEKIPRRALLRGAAATAVGAALAQTQTSPAAAAPPSTGDATSSARSLCTKPGGRDFPKIGGNYGNQNYSSLGRIHHGN